MVFVGLDLSWLNTIAAQAQLPPQATLLAFDDKGTVFVRYSEQKQWPSTSAVNPSLVKTILEQKEGFTEAEGPDGVRRLFGFTTLHHSSKTGALFVSVGIPTEVAFANSQRIFYDSLLVLLVAALLAVAGTWLGAHLLIRRRLEKLIATARALGMVNIIKLHGRQRSLRKQPANSIRSSTKCGSRSRKQAADKRILRR